MGGRVLFSQVASKGVSMSVFFHVWSFGTINFYIFYTAYAIIHMILATARSHSGTSLSRQVGLEI